MYRARVHNTAYHTCVQTFWKYMNEGVYHKTMSKLKHVHQLPTPFAAHAYTHRLPHACTNLLAVDRFPQGAVKAELVPYPLSPTPYTAHAYMHLQTFWP